MSDPFANDSNRVDEEAGSLPSHQRSLYFERCTAELKDPDTYFALMWVFGLVGAHYFYLGKSAQGLASALATAGGLLIAILSLASGNPLLIAVGFTILFAGAVALMIIHLVLGRHGIFRYNLERKRAILAFCQGSAAASSPPPPTPPTLTSQP